MAPFLLSTTLSSLLVLGLKSSMVGASIALVLRASVSVNSARHRSVLKWLAGLHQVLLCSSANNLTFAAKGASAVKQICPNEMRTLIGYHNISSRNHKSLATSPPHDAHYSSILNINTEQFPTLLKVIMAVFIQTSEEERHLYVSQCTSKTITSV